ncbi:BA75_01999T0 [Komagataella pastoris]|uniref:BA75_01999T0 n=1 Tax=Komagataella pastoris TaxID=4922 RepID=A0A1B2JCT8_PICPA|nr:BA75_01999T0 [Komagataella pastoris]
MEKSKSIAGIVGPTLTVMVFSEMRLWNPTLYDTQIVPLIYLNGVLLFVAGLSIVKSHNIWRYGWQTLITVVGYSAIVLGLFRMFFPQIQKAGFKNNNYISIVEIAFILIGIFLMFKAYFPQRNSL